MNRRSNTPVTRLASFCLLAAASALIACGATSTMPSARAPEPDPSQHVVRSERLRLLMRSMESLMHDRIQSDLELDKERLKQADELAEAAGELAATAEAIAGASTYASLDDAARARFDAFVVELQREASELQRLARDGQFAPSAAQFDRMRHVCAGCHSLYRVR